MKNNILILFFLALCSMASAQTNYDEEHEEENFSLNTTLNSNRSYHYTASSRIDLNPGFSYAPARGKSALFEIDPMMVVPPSAGITGGPNPTVDNGVVGAIGGTVNVSALGGAVYSIPIEVLPGKDGMQPSLSVTYNSQAGNGLLGYGWSLSGLSSITRCGRTIYHDLTQTSDAVDYTDDRFMLDGQRLLSISDNIAYGQSGCEYRTEIDNIAKVVSYDGDGQNPDKFKVWTKDGFIIEYGYTTSSKLIYRNDTVAMWMINKISDYNGNYMTYHYHTTTNSCRINYIEYTGCGNVQPMYKVQFNYIDRDDKEYYYLYNQKIVSDVLLDNISIKYQDNEVYKYTFVYDGISPENGRFYIRLMSIGMEQGDVRLNPTTIEWGDFEPYCDTVNNPTSGFKDICFAGDYNGDGIDDIVTFPYTTQPDNNWTCLYGNGDGTFSSSNINYANNIAGKDIVHIRPCDLNGDGLCDLLAETQEIHNSSFNPYYTVHLYAYLANSNGVGFTDTIEIRNYDSDNNNFDMIQIGDFLGNGKNDILVLLEANGPNGHGIYATLLSYDLDNSNNKFNNVFTNVYVRSSCDDVIPGDFNGDGRMEIILTEGNQSTQYSVNNNGLTPITNGFPSKWHICFPGDFNGDGKTDILSWVTDNNLGPRWEISISTAHGFPIQLLVESDQSLPLQKPSRNGPSIDIPTDNEVTYSINVCDMDGDGKSDVVFVFNNYVKIYHSPVCRDAWNSNSCYFIRDSIITNNPTNNYAYGQNRIGYNHIGKFKSTAFCSLLLRYNAYSPQPYLLESFDNQHKQNYVKTITDGLGNAVSFNYDYFTNPDFYTISSGNRFININDRVRKQMIPLKALRSITAENVSGTSVTTQYSYEDLYYHMTGRGIIGFKKSIINNITEGIKTVNINRYAGSNRIALPFLVPQLSTTYLVNGNTEQPVNETETTCVLMAGHSIPNQRVPIAMQTTSVTVKNYNANGSFKNMEIAEYHYYNGDNVYIYNNIDYIQKGYASSDSYMYAWACPLREDVSISYHGVPQTGDWIISRVNTQTTTFIKQGENNNKTNSVSYEYNSNHPNLVASETVIPNNSNDLTVTTEYNYNFSAGNISSVEQVISVTSLQRRYSIIDYSSQYQYRFATTTTNSLDHSVTSTYDPKFGWKLSDTDCNGLTTNYTRDFFGLDFETISPDGIKTHTSKRWSLNHAHAPNSATYYTWTQSSGSYPTMTFYHKTGVPLRYVSHGIDGQTIYVDMTYDDKGNLHTESLPYEAGNSPEGFITYSYDRLNRVVLTEYPDGTSDEVVYNGNEISYIHHDSGNRSSQTITKKYHPNGWLEQTTDSGGNTVKYVYNSDGTLKSAYVDGSNSAVTLTYNAAGMRDTICDPDYGCMSYIYNAFGEIISQKTPKGVVTEYEYDALGRMVQRKMKVPREPDEITVWKYSSESGHIGTLERILFNSSTQTITYQYDNLQRVIQTNETYGNTTYSTSYTYNQLGRLSAETYPSGFQVKNKYNSGGYLIAVKDSDDNTIWHADEHDIYGHLTEFHTGDGLTTYRDYDSENGRLLGIITSDGRNLLQNYAYTYDDFGNFASRKKFGSPMLQENFTYDNFNRLTTINTNGTTYRMAYDRYGRMESKSQYGFAFDCARYSSDHPHAMSRVQTQSLPPFAGHTVTYTPFDKVHTITQGSDNILIEYGYNRQRIRMTETVNGNQRVKTYVGNCEFIQPSTGDNYSLTYLSSPDGIFAVAESTSNGYRLHYVHTDNLGSWDIITDKNGHLEQSLSFDAWGNRRNASTWNGSATDTPLFDRGFTGHEHLYNFGLINMNGRVYDPYMSTFLSPDNYIQAPDNSQNFNRYAYCLNNPLKYTDPSGEDFIVAAILIGGAILGAYNGGALTNGGNYDISQWKWNDATITGVIGGAAVGGLSAGVGVGIAGSGVAFCGTASIAASSLVYSSGMYLTGCVAGFDYDISISLGAVSYNLTQGEFGYIFKKGNSIGDNIGYGLGAIVNACDLYRFATWQALSKQKRFNKLEKWAAKNYEENNLKYVSDLKNKHGVYDPATGQIQLSDLALSQDYGWAKSTYLHERNHRLEMYPIKNQINNLSRLAKNGDEEAAETLKKIYNASDAHSYELELRYAAKNGLSLSQFQDIRTLYIDHCSQSDITANKYNYTLWQFLKSLLLP